VRPIRWVLWLVEPNSRDELTLYRVVVTISQSGYAELGEGQPRAWRQLLAGAHTMIRRHVETYG